MWPKFWEANEISKARDRETTLDQKSLSPLSDRFGRIALTCHPQHHKQPNILCFPFLLRWIALTCLQASNALNPATPIPQEQTKKLPLVKIGDRQTDRHPDPKIGPQTPGSVKNIIRKSWMKRRRGGIQAGISRICLKNIINIIEKYYKNIIKISQGRGGEGHTVWYQQPQSESGSGGHNGCGGHLQYFGGHNTFDTILLWTQNFRHNTSLDTIILGHKILETILWWTHICLYTSSHMWTCLCTYIYCAHIYIIYTCFHI